MKSELDNQSAVDPARLLTFVWRTLLIPILFLQIGSAQYRFDSFTTDNGLPQNSCRNIVQTPDGYLWLTTFDGLVRYDGAKFTVFDRSNSPGISSNRFTGLSIDDNGTLLAATEDGGLTVYRDGKFRSFTTADGLPANDAVFGLDRRGAVFLATSKGNVYFRDGSFVPVPDAAVFNRAGFYSKPTGNTWQIEKEGVRHTAPDGRETFYPLKTEFYNDNFGGLGMFEDRGGGFWFGDRGGIYRLQNGEITKWGESAGVPRGLILRPSVEDDDGSIWFASNLGGPGLARYSDGRFTTWDTTDGLSSNLVVTIFKDREGTIWLTTADRGLNRVQKQIVTPLSTGNGLIHSEVYPLLQTRGGDIYVGTTQGLSRYADGKFTDVEGPSGWVNALAEDDRGRVWIGADDGVALLENGKLRAISLGATASAIYPGSGNVMWAGTSKGLFKLMDGQIVGHFTTRDGLPSDDIRFIHAGENGALWLGTYGGLSEFKDGNFTNYTERDGLASDRVRTIHRDERGTLWIGTYDGGVSRFADGKFFNFTVNNGLSSNGVFAILDDERGNFWISSNRGISRISRNELEEAAAGRLSRVNNVAYGKQDGMLNSECNGGRQPAGVKIADGKLWFPTMDGVAIVDPKQVSYNPQPPPVQIESVLIERQPTDFKNGITLRANENNLEIRYTGISFIKPEQVKFRYRVEGMDENWTDVGTIRELYFPSLPAGEYTFRVIAANSDGVWNEQGASVALSVLPPFWQTWWFLLLAAIFTGAIVFLLYRRRIVMLQKANFAKETFAHQLIESQENERRRIAAELHDSLGQSLVLIKNWALLGLQAEQKQTSAKPNLDEISETASDAIKEVREIAYNLGPFQLERLGLRTTIVEMVQKVGVSSSIRFDVAIDEIDELFGKDEQVNIFRIVQEAISNIVKHSDATRSSLQIKKVDQRVILTITDDGKGFAQDAAETKSGFGLLGMTERVNLLKGEFSINSRAGGGTTIRVILPF